MVNSRRTHLPVGRERDEFRRRRATCERSPRSWTRQVEQQRLPATEDGHCATLLLVWLDL